MEMILEDGVEYDTDARWHYNLQSEREPLHGFRRLTR